MLMVLALQEAAAAAVVVAVAAETPGKRCGRGCKIVHPYCKSYLDAHQWALGQLEVAGSVAVVAVMVMVSKSTVAGGVAKVIGVGDGTVMSPEAVGVACAW